MSPEMIACIKKKGGGEQTGRLVGGGLGTEQIASCSYSGMGTCCVTDWDGSRC